jgi:hypothetical protein
MVAGSGAGVAGFSAAFACAGFSRGPEQAAVTAKVANTNRRNREALNSIQPL